MLIMRVMDQDWKWDQRLTNLSLQLVSQAKVVGRMAGYF